MGELQQGIQCSVKSPSVFRLECDPAVYRLTAVKKAAYKFGDRFHVRIWTGDAGIHVELEAKDRSGESASLVGEFCNELLDQELRELVAEETRPIRDILLSQAFSAISLLDPLGDEGDYRDDPKHINAVNVPGPPSMDESSRGQ